MLRFWFIICIGIVSSHTYAQNQTNKDSLSIGNELLIGINKKALEEFRESFEEDNFILNNQKEWMQFNEKLPNIMEQTTPTTKQKKRLSLKPYTANTPYNWDPIRKRKIKVDKNTWKNNNADISISRFISKSLKEEFPKQGISTDLMKPFTRDFWRFKWKKARKETKIVLDNY
ncbi:MAG: DUF4858 domain-containing protein [Mediterranea massiliensis]|nr:DUF4858 domain-containing protein [Mediterranea massiliensis]